MNEPESPFREFLERMGSAEAGPLLGRLEELRSRLVKSMALVFAIFVVCFVFAQNLLLELEKPLAGALPAGAKVLHFTGPMEVFVAYVQVSFTLALCIAMPVLFLQTWAFVKPALPDVDKRMVMPFFLSSVSLFVGGVLFCFFVMMPPALSFLIGMGAEVATPTIMVEDYVSLTTFMLLGFGLVFQMPVVIVLLERLGVVELSTFRESRRYVIVAIVTIAAIVTPTPDPLSQMGMAIPMYVMFEGALLVIVLLRRREQKALAVVEAKQQMPGPPKG